MKFEDRKEVLPQVKELENLVLKLQQKAIKLNNVFIARAIINKLPPSWFSFSTEMCRRKKQVSLDDLKRFIRIEDEARTHSQIELLEKQKATANMIEAKSETNKGIYNVKKKKYNPKKKWNKKNLNVQKKDFKKKGQCFNCGKYDHFARDCRAPPKNKELKESVNVVIGNEEILDFVAVISHVEGTSDSTYWWLDTGATCHVCTNKSLFSSYVASKEKVAMVDRSTTDVLGSGTVVLTLTSGKTLTLKNVKHVPSIPKNLVSGSLLCDAGMRLDFHGGKDVLSYNNVYFENAYRTDGMSIVSSVVNEITGSDYSSELWHNKLDHVNYRKLQDMKSLGLLPKCGGDKPESSIQEEVEKQQNRPVKKLRNDRGGEYRSNEAKAYFKEHGIVAETTAPYSPQSNGITERKNRTLTEMCGGVFHMLEYQISGDQRLDQGLICAYFWGSLKIVMLEGLWLGTNSIIEARDGEFFEDKSIKDKNVTLSDLPENSHAEESTEPEVVSLPAYQEIINGDSTMFKEVDVNDSSIIPESHEPRSKRIKKAKSFGDNFMTYSVEADPQTFKEVISSRDALLWKEAVNDEMDSLI
ncbi:uncharacterized protein LOC143883110 [Tasmannia lanceolata]|uniref:uncharacterized protein LOC143883110 n=1 Tax=Tasmannia lanceolata TaxID=3420 RepID=UPI0040643BA0